LFIISLAAVTTLAWADGHVENEVVAEWSKKLSHDLFARMNEVAEFDKIKELVESQSFLREKLDPQDVTNKVSLAIQNIVDKTMRSAERIAAALAKTEGVKKDPATQYYDACSRDLTKLPNLVQNDHYKTKVNLSYTSLMINNWAQLTEAEKNDVLREIARLEDLDEAFVQNGVDDEFSTLQYVGTPSGLYKVFPSQQWVLSQCAPSPNAYDPRKRPWYVSTNAGPKDLVLLIDSSNSMMINDRFERVTAAASRIINTLSESDFINVIFFDSEAHMSCFNRTLVRATPDNKQILMDFILSAETSEGTDFHAAFSTAFEMIQHSLDAGVGSGCPSDTVILFLTDGQSDDPSDYIDAHDLKGLVKIFSYVVGKPTDTGVPMSLACNNDGSFATVSDTGDIGAVLSNYYMHMGHGTASWTLPYFGSSQGQLMVTYAIPVYSSKEQLLGVVGVDLPLAAVEEAINAVLAQSGGNGYAFLVDFEGDAVFHPDFKASSTLRFFDIELQETLVNTEDFLRTTRKATEFYASVRRSMVDGTRGTRKLAVTRNYLPSGLYTLNVTYFFTPVAGTAFSVGTVWPSNNIQQLLFPDDIEGGWSENLVYGNFEPYYEDETLVPSLEIRNDVHLHERENVSLTHASVSFVNDLFCSPEAVSDNIATAFEISLMLNSTTNTSCDTDAALDPYFVRPTLRLGSNFVDLWKESYNHLNNSDFISVIYYGDQHGTSVNYPGMILPDGFDPRSRLWYRRALVADGVASVSTPYIGVSTDGKFFISLAKALIHDGVPLGVVGSDIQLRVMQNALYSISEGNCALENGPTRCYIIDGFGYLVSSPTFNMTKLLQEADGNPERVEEIISSRFLGKELGPVVNNMVYDGILIPHDIIVTNKVCKQDIVDIDDDDDQSKSTSPAPRLKPLVNSFLNMFNTQDLKKNNKRSTTTVSTRKWPCLFHQTYYKVDSKFFEQNKIYETLVSHPRMVGTATLSPIPNTTVYLLVFQGRIDGLTANDVVDVNLEPLGHDDLIAQRNVDRHGAKCPSDVKRECLTCPGLNETGFICNGRGDCIDGVCHCPDGNITPYCLNGSILMVPSLTLFFISLIILLYHH